MNDERLPRRGAGEPDPDPVMANQAEADWSKERASDDRLTEPVRRRLGLAWPHPWPPKA